MFNITFPTDTESIIDAIRGAIGRDITLFVPVVSGCTVCSLDPINNTSTDAFCPICSGQYWITTYSGYTVSGHVTWGPEGIVKWVPGGQYFDGDCLVQIKYTDEAVTVVDHCHHLIVDNKKLTIKSKVYRGVQNLNRILLNLQEDEV